MELSIYLSSLMIITNAGKILGTVRVIQTFGFAAKLGSWVTLETAPIQNQSIKLYVYILFIIIICVHR